MTLDTQQANSYDIQHRLELALGAANMGAWEYDPSTGLSVWDACMFELTGLPTEVGAAASHKLLEIIHPDDRERVEAALAAQIAYPDTRSKYEFRIIKHDDGQTRWMTARSKMSSHNGHQRVYGVMFDVTDVKDAQAVLERDGQAKTEFLAMLSHELRAPLSPIFTALELMERTKDVEVVKFGIDIIRRQASHFQRLVDDLMDINRITSGRVRLNNERVNVMQAVNMALELSQSIIHKRGHSLTCTVPHEPVYLDGDQQRIVQILTNLIQNAAKYTQNDGHIWVEVTTDPTHVFFAIKDDGPGISDADKTEVFQLFSQAEGTRGTKVSEGGIGVGLALVKKLVELHHGTIELTDNVPMGCVFTVTIPRKARQTDRTV